MTSFDYRLNPLYTIKECSSCGALYTTEYCCSKGSLVDKIICDLNKAPDSPHLHTFSSNQRHCFHCKDVLGEGEFCQRCTCMRCGSGLSKGLCLICGNNQNSLNDSPSISENSSQSPPHINHRCCYECGDPLDGIFCKRCTCKSYGKGANIGYNCPPKVPVISNPEPCKNQTIDELPQTLPSSRPTCYSGDKSPFTCDSTPNYVDESPNVFNPPPQPPVYPCEFCGNDAYYGHYCTPQAPFIYPEPCYNQDFNFPQDFQTFPQQYPCCEDCGVTHKLYQCQPLNHDYYHGQNSCYDSNSIGFDQSQPQQYTVNHPIFNAHNDLLSSQTMLNEQMTQLKSMCEIFCQSVQKKREEKQIEEERAAKAKYWKPPVCYDDDDDEERSDSLNDNIISDLPPFSTITPDEPVLSTEEPDNSLSMGDEHLDTISATESDEFIKSDVKNIIPIPSESEGIPEHMCDVLSHDNSPPLDVSNDTIEDLFESNEEFSSTDDDSFSFDKIDYVEASPPDSELVSLEVMEIVIPKVGGIKASNDNPIPFYDPIIPGTPSNLTPSGESDFFLEVDAFLAVEDEFTSSQCPKSYLDLEGDMLLFEAFLNDDHSSDFKTKSSSTSLNSLLEETNNFDNSLPEFTTFSNDPFDAECESDSSDDQSCSDEDVLEKIVSKPLSEEEIIPMKSLRTHDSSLSISSKIDSLLDEFAGELTLLKSIPPGIDETDCDFEEDIRLIEKLLYDKSPFTCDSTPNYVDESPNVFNPPPQPPVYSCEFCGNDARYGYYCTPQVPFIYLEPCYNQDFNFPQNFHDFQQQYLCCENYGGPHEAYQCQPMSEDYYHEQNSCYDLNSFGFDQFQPPQYTVNHPIFNDQNDILNAQNDLFNSQNKLMEQLTSMCDMVGQYIQKKEEEKQITKEQAAKPRYWKIPICYDNDEDYTIAIKPKEPDNSLSMGDEHLNTILATESDEFIKSSVENLVPNLSESKGEHECDVLTCDDFTTFSNLVFDADDDFSSNDNESFSDKDILKKIYSNPLFDEEIISMKIDLHHFNAESDLIESMLNQDYSIISSSSKIDSLLDEFAEFNSENSDAIIESFSPSPIPVEDNDPFMEEIDLFLAFDGSIPPVIDSACSDSEGDNLFPERLLHDDPIPLPDILDFSNVV
uniref:Pre-mRNA splicing Prp18-interacting factor n=1 Tax=Tanacetum cinerariifolium TaxID=118510 RepID=A0A6L2J3E7_TANCI|nr:hypothetical protein [Tanacetum cinerariifolium]